MNNWVFFLDSKNWDVSTEPFVGDTQMLTIDESMKKQISIGDIGLVKIKEGRSQSSIPMYKRFSKQIKEGIYFIVEIASPPKNEFDKGKNKNRSKVEVRKIMSWEKRPILIGEIKEDEEKYKRFRGYGSCCRKIDDQVLKYILDKRK